MQSVIQILKVNDTRKGTSAKTGKPWEMQDAECLLLNDDGSINCVGVLTIPKDLSGKVTPGTFVGSFSLRASPMDRRIEAVITGLQPYTTKQVPKAA